MIPRILFHCIYKPATHPKLKYMNQMFGAHRLMMKPNVAISVPAIATIRHPNLLVRALAIGPAHTFKHLHQTLTLCNITST